MRESLFRQRHRPPGLGERKAVLTHETEIPRIKTCDGPALSDCLETSHFILSSPPQGQTLVEGGSHSLAGLSKTQNPACYNSTVRDGCRGPNASSSHGHHILDCGSRRDPDRSCGGVTQATRAYQMGRMRFKNCGVAHFGMWPSSTQRLFLAQCSSRRGLMGLENQDKGMRPMWWVVSCFS